MNQHVTRSTRNAWERRGCTQEKASGSGLPSRRGIDVFTSSRARAPPPGPVSQAAEA
jgi:hypothetical protein